MKILVPVDFSDSSFNAYKFANHLAFQMHCDLHLVHVLTGVVNPGEKFSIKANRGVLGATEDRLKSFSNWHPNQSDIDFEIVDTTTEVLVGDPVQEIVQATENDEIVLVVCGTRDSHNLDERWLGTVSSGIGRDSKVSTLLVPTRASFKRGGNIVVACRDRAVKDSFVKMIVEARKLFGAIVHLVHVNTHHEISRDDSTTNLLAKLHAVDPAPAVYEVKILDGYPEVELRSYTQRINADILILQASEKTWIQKVFSGSVSRKISLSTPVPTLVVH